ncbi:Uncharacterized membrane protein [Methylophilus rhizosphaerae]|uniref:Uncharacterized membrane protein n=1 Tax=Methylophilus rhizosphaerae TaxID=492660 RepID=A0A1G9ER78_9PROT|nr:DUF2231 domain-containing protein [Methylophilus rhizosphaerae]SDK78573.1 Uncharacterized membrane protein [Methylophilus rhizosphaerae]
MKQNHPLHPALVHFPITCWSLAAVADFASLWPGDNTWHWSAGLLAIGCGMAVIAMLAGLLELSYVPEGPAMHTTYWHMGLMLAACALFSARLLLRLENFQSMQPNAVSLILDSFGLSALLFGGWLGGKLVYHHNVRRLTK